MNNQLDVRPVKFGAFTIYRATGRKEPVKHVSISAAEQECERLLGGDPEGTYIISREEARVSLRRTASRSGVPLTRRPV